MYLYTTADPYHHTVRQTHSYTHIADELPSQVNRWTEKLQRPDKISTNRS